MLVLFIGILTNKLGRQKNNYTRGNLPNFIVERKYFLRPIAHCFAGG